MEVLLAARNCWGKYNRTLATCDIVGCNMISLEFYWQARRRVLERKGQKLLVMGGTRIPNTQKSTYF